MSDTKSKFLSDAESIKQKLDSVSPSLCLAKWKQVSLHLTTGMNNSCYHPPLHKISIEEIAHTPGALHNTAWKKEQRRRMLAGERPEECQYCWNMEDLGEMSDRHYRSGEPWAAIDFDRIANSTGYESRVLDDDDVPNKKYVNDYVYASGGSAIVSLFKYPVSATYGSEDTLGEALASSIKFWVRAGGESDL
jgi:hypothetical protein